MIWSLWTLSVSLITFVIDALLGGEPKQRQFSDEMFIKAWFCSKKLCLHCCMLSWYWLEFMIYHVFSLGFDFYIPIDFGLNVLFPHIFSVLHRSNVETCWFSLVMHVNPLTEQISMQSSLDSRISTMLLSVLEQSAFALPKTKLKHFGPD